jgi:hypothetical protein
MSDSIDPKLLDKRVAHRYLKKGVLEEKDYRKHLESLPDLSAQAEEIEAEFEPSAAPRPQLSAANDAADGSED